MNSKHLARVGRLLFGRSLRLQLGAWIVDRWDDRFFQKEAAEGVSYSQGAVGKELERFVALGMLVKEEQTPDDRRLYYRRTDSYLWEAIRIASNPPEGEID